MEINFKHFYQEVNFSHLTRLITQQNLEVTGLQKESQIALPGKRAHTHIKFHGGVLLF